MKFRELWIKNPPHPFRGKRAKLKYVTQYSTQPPEFSFNLSKCFAAWACVTAILVIPYEGSPLSL